MTQVNIPEAEMNLDGLIGMLETGRESQILIARHGTPVAAMTLYAPPAPAASKRIGVAKGKFLCPDDLDKYNDEIADLWGV